MVYHFNILYLYPEEGEEKWIEGYIHSEDISFAADEIMEELELAPKNISSIKIDRGKKIIVL